MQRFVGTEAPAAAAAAAAAAAQTSFSFFFFFFFSGFFSSLLVGIRENFTHIRVVVDKTGCQRLSCNVSWAWFVLWAGSAAQHFYSNPPKTVPCVMWLRDPPPKKTSGSRTDRGLKTGSLEWILSTEHQDTTSFTLQRL
ncbi:Hypothetical predicted protein [Xyrichtys novacula]|uniref:Secreted protein n=1 Tax=Xyrichtys novacula TaxID=13765 RepID=A0AAV1G448_XYRNO|nr:Hypothetical predicted protein [Xyrichtys novacula]